MLATARPPHIGHAAAARVAQHAARHGTTLRAAALALGVTTESECDAWVDPWRMLRPDRA